MLKPSRRIPKAFQRTSSDFSKNIASKLFRRRKKKTSHRFSKLVRHWRRIVGTTKTTLTRARAWCAIGIVLFIALMIAFFLLSSTFSVTSMRVSRQDRRTDTEEIQKLLQPYFGKHIFFVSPLLIERNILTAYPEVASAEVSRNFPNELQVKLYMQPIIARVAIGDPGDTEQGVVSETWQETEEQHLYLTQNGVFLEYPFSLSLPDEYLSLYLVDWAVKPEHRQKLIQGQPLAAVQHAQRILQETFGHSAHFITYYLRAKEFHVQTEGSALWFDLVTPVSVQIDRYRQFLRAVPLEEVEEYVDLRLHDRVVYR